MTGVPIRYLTPEQLEARRDAARLRYAALTPAERTALARKNYAAKERKPAPKIAYVADENVSKHTGDAIKKILGAAKLSAEQRDRGFVEWVPKPATQVIIDQIKEVLEEYSEHLPLTARQIYYRLIDGQGHTKGKEFERQLYTILRRGRRAEVFDMDAIRDDGGTTETGPQAWESAEQWIDATRGEIEELRMDRQEGQDNRLVIYCEAAGMVPQIARVANRYGVHVMSSGGFDSITEKHAMGRDLDNTEVLHIGDLDPSGIHVFISLAEDVSAFAEHYGNDVDFTRLAVTPKQVKKLKLHTSPRERNPDGTWKDDRAYPHDFTCQAEAISPDDLANIVRDAITDPERFDRDAYDEVLAAEEELHAELEDKLT
jgi:hypothetical protein